MTYQLYVVTHIGFYPVLNATPPTKERGLLEKIDDVLRELRPGYGKHYTTIIIPLTEVGLLDEDTFNVLRKKQKSLP